MTLHIDNFIPKNYITLITVIIITHNCNCSCN